MRPGAPRQIDVSRAKKHLTGRTPQAAALPRAEAAPDAPGKSGAKGKAPAHAKKGRRRAGKIVLCVLAALLAVALALFAAGYWYLSQIFSTSGEGAGGELTNEETFTPPQLAESQINFVVLGLDYLEDAVERDRGSMLTDMILYCQYDSEAKTLKMLQIPRDVFVERPQETAQTGKINALYSFGASDTNKVQNLTDVLYDMFKLPVDYYVTIEMEALVEFTNTFGGGGGLEVYVPKTLEYDGSRLEQGWQVLRGEDLEFFLRCRKGPGMASGDYDRLENQKYFYSALFRYVRTMSVTEMVKIMPVCVKYVNTNMPMNTCIALGLEFLSGGVPDENIVIGRLPVYGMQVYYTDSALEDKPLITNVPAQETADFLNRYFRPADAPVAAEELNIPTFGDPAEWGGVSMGTMSHMAADGTVEEGAGAVEAQSESGLSASGSAPVAAAESAAAPSGVQSVSDAA